VIGQAWALKEAFRAIYRAADRAGAEEQLERFLGAVDRAVLPAFSSFAAGPRGWGQELLAYFDEPTTRATPRG
jgi:transposase